MTFRPEQVDPDEVEVYYQLTEDGVTGPLSRDEATRLLGTQFLNEFAFDLDGRLVLLDELEEETG